MTQQEGMSQHLNAVRNGETKSVLIVGFRLSRKMRAASGAEN